MKPNWVFLAVLVVGLVVGASPSFGASPPTISLTQQSTVLNPSTLAGSNGQASWYLVGTWNNLDGDTRGTFVQVVNPGPNTLWAFVTFWDVNEQGVKCEAHQLSANGAAEVVVVGDQGTSPSAFSGTVKVLSTNNEGKPEFGLVGYRKGIHSVPFDGSSLIRTTEIRLQPLPQPVLLQDFNNDVDHFGDEIYRIALLCNTP